jgi:hypothetical protein
LFVCEDDDNGFLTVVVIIANVIERTNGNVNIHKNIFVVRQGQAANKKETSTQHQSNRTVDDRALDIGWRPRRAAVVCAAFHHSIIVCNLRGGI